MRAVTDSTLSPDLFRLAPIECIITCKLTLDALPSLPSALVVESSTVPKQIGCHPLPEMFGPQRAGVELPRGSDLGVPPRLHLRVLLPVTLGSFLILFGVNFAFDVATGRDDQILLGRADLFSLGLRGLGRISPWPWPHANAPGLSPAPQSPPCCNPPSCGPAVGTPKARRQTRSQPNDCIFPGVRLSASDPAHSCESTACHSGRVSLRVRTYRARWIGIFGSGSEWRP